VIRALPVLPKAESGLSHYIIWHESNVLTLACPGREPGITGNQNKVMQLLAIRGKVSPLTKHFLFKSLLIMKFSFLLFMITLQVSARSYSQNISISAQDASLAKVFEKIQKKSGYLFWYEDKLLNHAGKVNIDIKNASIKETLDECFKNQPLTYAIVGKTIVVIPKYVASTPTPLSLFLPIKIAGRVTDDKGNTLTGVTVQVKGSPGGTVTDEKGTFTIEAPDENSVLKFSYVGYQTKEVPLDGRPEITVILEPSVSSLDQLVVVGYGVQKKADLTGSISTISNTAFQQQPIIRVSDAIKGRAAGVMVNTPNGAPGSGIKIRIRGSNSINGDNTPLYVIDGFVGGDIRTINPDDIASIDILKDASATAIYGSRGANGVVIITTKTGKANRHLIEFSTFYSMDKVSKKYDLLNGPQFMEMANARNQALGLDPVFTQAQIDAGKSTGGTDWQDAVMRTGSTQNYELAFSGGNNKTRYYLSGNMADQQGIILNSWYKRYGLRVNLNSDFGNKFHVAFNAYGTYEKSRNNYNYSGRNNAYGEALVFPPNLPVFDSTGEYTTTSDYSYGPVAGNPVFAANTQNLDSRIFTILSNAQLSYDFTSHLQLSVSGGVNGISYNTPSFKQAAPGTPLSTSQGEYDNGFTWALQNTNKLHYENTFGGIHKLDISAIYEQQRSVTNTNYVIASTFPTISLGYNNLGLGLPFRAGSGYSEWAIQSYLGRINYQLMNKYLFTFTFRADGSSKFRGKNKYGYFPSGAIAWRMSDESFIRNINFFQNLKLRASYGLTGSQAINPYQTLTVLSPGNNYLFDGVTKTVGIGPGAPGNPNLKWETTAQADIGLDFSIFHDRLSGTLDYYHKKTTDLLMPVPIPDYAGGQSNNAGGRTITSNIGSLQNKGFEILLNGSVIDHANFKINTTVNLSINRNKILNLGTNDEILTNSSYADAGKATLFILKVGEPLGVMRGLVYEGLWQSKETDEAAKYGEVPGDPKYKDINNDGAISGNDMVAIGNANPKFTWGWNTDITISHFDLNIFFNGVQGNDVWNMTRFLIVSTGSDVKFPTSKEILNHWTPSNPHTDIPGFSPTSATQLQSSQYMENGSFARLSNITLGYNFSAQLLRKWKINNARIYLSAQNLFVLTKYNGEDPELSNTPTSTDVAAGIDNGTYPAFRTYTIGIKLGF
jgi:TonB-linked SusC/RagA family outer membrane protein